MPDIIQAPGNGIDDATLAVQAALDGAANGAALLLPVGHYRISAPLVLTGRRGVALLGEAAAWGVGSCLVWRGGPDRPLLTLRGCRDCRLEHLALSSNPTAALAEGIRSETLAGQVSTCNRFTGLYVDGTSKGGLGYGFRWVQGAGSPDANNDACCWTDCRVANYSQAAWSFEHMQSVLHELRGCGFHPGGAGGLNGVRVKAGAFSWYGGGGGPCADADFWIEAAARCMVIEGADCEGSARFVRTGGPLNALFPLVLRGCRWPGDGLHPDGRAVIYGYRGALSVEGCLFGTASRNPTVPVIQMAVAGPTPALVTGNAFGRQGSDQVKPLVWSSPAYARGTLAGNVYVTAGGVPVAPPESLS